MPTYFGQSLLSISYFLHFPLIFLFIFMFSFYQSLSFKASFLFLSFADSVVYLSSYLLFVVISLLSVNSKHIFFPFLTFNFPISFLSVSKCYFLSLSLSLSRIHTHDMLYSQFVKETSFQLGTQIEEQIPSLHLSLLVEFLRSIQIESKMSLALQFLLVALTPVLLTSNRKVIGAEPALLLKDK